jgi:hypothetical protein
VKLLIVPPAHVDREWSAGANQLAEACKWASREITPDQLKMLLARGERTLLALDDDGKHVAWAATQVQQLPNIRVLYIYSIFARGETGEEAFRQLADYARFEGCSSIRGACSDSIARLWQAKLGAKIIYHTCEIEVQP